MIYFFSRQWRSKEIYYIAACKDYFDYDFYILKKSILYNYYQVAPNILKSPFTILLI